MKILTDTGLMVLWQRIKDLYKKISVSAKQTTTSTADGGTNVMTFTFGDGTSTTFSVKNGSKGSDGAKGEKGDRGPVGETGPQGNSGIADASNKALINDAVTGGETSYLSAEVGKLGILTYDCSKGGTVEHASLQDAINAVPTTFRKVGITIIYKSGDSIYRYALKSNSWSTDSTNWFSVEEKVSDLFTSNVINTEDGNYILGKVIQDNGGYNADTYAGYATTGYIKCHKNQIFTFAYGTTVEVWVAFFNKNKNAISSRFYHKTTSTVSIPDDANIKYFRVSYKISDAKDCLYDYDGIINTISKYGFINMLASKIHIQELNCDKISCKEFVQSADSERLKADWEFACSKILCIGDSLTDGLYVPNSSGVHKVGIVEENYPYYLGRMLNASIKNVGKSGSHPSKFYNDWILKLTYTDYDFVFIWLGTNGGMKNPASADAQPRSPMYEAYYYEQIIKKIKDANPNLKIVLATVFAVGNISDTITPASVSETNNIINSIGKKYDLQVIDFSDLEPNKYLQLRNGIANTHFAKAGNIYIASRIKNELNLYLNNNPIKCEFGLSKKAEHEL